MKKFKLFKVSPECHRITKLYATAQGFSLGEVVDYAIAELINNDKTLTEGIKTLIFTQPQPNDESTK